MPLVASDTDLSFSETFKKVKAATPTREVGYWAFVDERIYVYALTEDERTYAMLARNALAGRACGA